MLFQLNINSKCKNELIQMFFEKHTQNKVAKL